MEIVRCKRCNAILKAEKSRKLGYGRTCYRIVQLQETNKPNPKINNEIAFLKMEIKQLKRMIRNIQVNGKTIESIESIKKEVITIPDILKQGFSNVVKEMKTIFTENFNYHDVLKPVNPIDVPVNPPIQVLI